jgi:hypothetical protein
MARKEETCEAHVGLEKQLYKSTRRKTSVVFPEQNRRLGIEEGRAAIRDGSQRGGQEPDFVVFCN